MDHLLNSRLSQMNQSPTKLENLSPQKFGKAAYADLCYTPSKLADNALYREVVTLKKYEDGTNKLRQFQAMNSYMKDRIKQIEEERDGIEKSLTQQIVMYKKMLNEMESKHQLRIKQIQKKFGIQLHRLIQQKQQQAKFAQSEKQLLERRIFELEQIIESLKDKLDNTTGQLEDLTNQHEKLIIQHGNLKEKFEDQQKKRKNQNEKAKQQYQKLSRKLYNTQVQWQNKLQNAINSKNKQIQNLQRLHKTQLQKIQNKRQAETMMKNQQIKDLRQTFENQAKRLNEIVNMKDRMIDSLTKENNKEKQTILDLTKNYQNQINNLVHQKGRLLEQVQHLNRENNELNAVLKDAQNSFAQDRASLEKYIDKLKEQLEFAQCNFIRERDRGNVISTDFERQLGKLRIQNDRMISVSRQNQVLCRQVKNLRELLMESSMEMEKCKEQFIKMGCEKDQLLLRLKQLGFENQTLHRIKMERQQEARGWKDSYYLNRMHH